jgi:hypothetical protein
MQDTQHLPGSEESESGGQRAPSSSILPANICQVPYTGQKKGKEQSGLPAQSWRDGIYGAALRSVLQRGRYRQGSVQSEARVARRHRATIDMRLQSLYTGGGTALVDGEKMGVWIDRWRDGIMGPNEIWSGTRMAGRHRGRGVACGDGKKASRQWSAHRWLKRRTGERSDG